jgi:hypothetical protein
LQKELEKEESKVRAGTKKAKTDYYLTKVNASSYSTCKLPNLKL